ncbi:DUF2510 domain-containing protein, partial [Streptomyces corynorhini]
MATPPGDDGNVPREGFYPDPSIPGYVRYWNGASWVPGTSRPAPRDEEAPRAALPPAPARPGFEETGPVFLDEEQTGPARQEPASAWQADASRQSGFGGDGAARVSWGAPGQDPRIPRPAPPAGPVDPRIDASAGAPGPGDPTGGALPGMRALGAGADASGGQEQGTDAAPAADRPVSDGTVAIRADRRGTGGGTGTGTGHDALTPARPLVPPTSAQPPVDSTVAIRALRAARR